MTSDLIAVFFSCSTYLECMAQGPTFSLYLHLIWLLVANLITFSVGIGYKLSILGLFKTLQFGCITKNKKGTFLYCLKYDGIRFYITFVFFVKSMSCLSGWYGTMRYSSGNAWLHFSGGTEITGRRRVLRQGMWLVVSWSLLIWNARRWVKM